MYIEKCVLFEEKSNIKYFDDENHLTKVQKTSESEIKENIPMTKPHLEILVASGCHQCHCLLYTVPQGQRAVGHAGVRQHS